MRINDLFVCAGALFCVVNAHGAELGRKTLDSTSATVIRQPVDTFAGKGYAVEGRLKFCNYKWDIGDDGFKHFAVVPQVVGSAYVSDNLDLRMGMTFVYLKDNRFLWDEGVIISPNMTLFRTGVGLRFWVNREAMFPLYLDTELGYYLMSGKDVSVRTQMASLSGGLGVAYAIEDGTKLLFGLTFEQAIRDGKVRRDGVDRDISLQHVGLELGLKHSF